MKSCKRWTSSGPATCALCRQVYPASTTGVLCDLATPVENTTLVKFICDGCSGPIATAVVGPHAVQFSAEQRRQAELMTEMQLQASRGRK